MYVIWVISANLHGTNVWSHKVWWVAIGQRSRWGSHTNTHLTQWICAHTHILRPKWSYTFFFIYLFCCCCCYCLLKFLTIWQLSQHLFCGWCVLLCCGILIYTKLFFFYSIFIRQILVCTRMTFLGICHAYVSREEIWHFNIIVTNFEQNWFEIDTIS